MVSLRPTGAWDWALKFYRHNCAWYNHTQSGGNAWVKSRRISFVCLHMQSGIGRSEVVRALLIVCNRLVTLLRSLFLRFFLSCQSVRKKKKDIPALSHWHTLGESCIPWTRNGSIRRRALPQLGSPRLFSLIRLASPMILSQGRHCEGRGCRKGVQRIWEFVLRGNYCAFYTFFSIQCNGSKMQERTAILHQ